MPFKRYCQNIHFMVIQGDFLAMRTEFLASAPELLKFDLLDTFKIAFPSTGPALLASNDLTGEACLPDGRWLRISRSKTQEGGRIWTVSGRIIGAVER
jgi:hypothetical protein